MTLPPGVVLRPAVPSDAEPGADLQRECWREAYGPLVDPAVLGERLAARHRWVAAWERQLATGRPRVVAEGPDGQLLGFAVAGPSRDEEPPTPMELYALYTRAAWWGTGLGRSLWAAVEPEQACSLWVLEANERAQAFYRRHGFGPDGAREHYADLDAWEIRMVRR